MRRSRKTQARRIWLVSLKKVDSGPEAWTKTELLKTIQQESRAEASGLRRVLQEISQRLRKLVSLSHDHNHEGHNHEHDSEPEPSGLQSYRLGRRLRDLQDHGLVEKWIRKDIGCGGEAFRLSSMGRSELISELAGMGEQ